MHYLALCAIVKDEDQYLREWLAFYLETGVEHFYIFDNDSVMPVAELLADFPSSIFTINRVNGKEQQIPAYNKALTEYKKQCRWLGFLDADEFVFPLKGRDLRPLLAEFEDYAGLAVPWTVYGSSGHLKKPAGLVIENYLHRYADEGTGWHNIIKCFVDPNQVSEAINPHRFLPLPGKYLVNEQHIPLPPGTNRVIRSDRRIRLNHYFFKSQQEYEAKLDKGRADRVDEKGRYRHELFQQQCHNALTRDNSIAPFVNITKKRLENPAKPLKPGGCDLDLHQVSDLVSAYSMRNQFEEAEAAFCRTRAADTIAPDFWLFRSIIAKARGELGRAELFIKKALRAKGSAEIYWEFYEIAAAQKDYSTAMATLCCLENYLNSNALSLEKTESWRTKIIAAKGKLGSGR